MAVARKCDRCGKLYEIYNTKDSEKKINGLITINKDETRKYYSHGSYDLCPECSKELIEWLCTDVIVRCDFDNVKGNYYARPDFRAKCMNGPSKFDREAAVIGGLQKRIEKFAADYGCKANYSSLDTLKDQLLLSFHFSYMDDNGYTIVTPECYIARSSIDPLGSLENMLKTFLNNSPILRTRRKEVIERG